MYVVDLRKEGRKTLLSRSKSIQERSRRRRNCEDRCSVNSNTLRRGSRVLAAKSSKAYERQQDRRERASVQGKPSLPVQQVLHSINAAGITSRGM